MMETRTILRTIEAEIMQKLKNNEARPKFTGSYKKKRVELECLTSAFSKRYMTLYRGNLKHILQLLGQEGAKLRFRLLSF